MSATERLLQMDSDIISRPFIRSPEKIPYHWFDLITDKRISFPEGIEAETGEFLYGLVRMARPKYILETGTRIGISTRYLALALKDNDLGGCIISFERDGFCAGLAIEGLKKIGLDGNVLIVAEDSRDFNPGELKKFDMLYLDTEPEYRYEELLKFFPNLIPGGLAVIHDLATLDDRAFGGCPLEVGRLILNGELRAFNFPTCSGLTVFQKAYEIDSQREIMTGVKQ